MPRIFALVAAVAVLLIGIFLDSSVAYGAPLALGWIIDYNGVPFQSPPVTWANNSKLRFDLAFLQTAKRMAAPVIQRVSIRFAGSVSAAGGDTVGADAYKLLAQMFVKDRGGELLNWAGTIHRVHEQIILGNRQRDQVAITSAGTNAAFVQWWHIFFAEPDNAKNLRADDTGLPLDHLLPEGGGEIFIRTQSPTNYSVNSGAFDLFVDVVDERRKELKARRVRRTQAIGKTEDYYPVGGSLKTAAVTSELATTGYTALGDATYTSVISRTLDLQTIPPTELRERYRLESPSVASGDEVMAGTVAVPAPTCIPLVTPRQGQHLFSLPDVEQLHVKLPAAPASGQILLDYIEDRDPQLAAQWMGYATPADLNAAIMARGHVKGMGDHEDKITSWDPRLVRRGCIRID